MKSLRIITVGKNNQEFLKEGLSFYQKRLKPYCQLEIIELKEIGYGKLPEQKILENESEIYRTKIGSDDLVIGLDREGKELSSEKFAGLLEKEAIQGRTKLTFLIGGIYGLAPDVLEKCDYRISFSQLTFPHQLFRVILLEQLYRAFKIIRGEPYHY